MDVHKDRAQWKRVILTEKIINQISKVWGSKCNIPLKFWSGKSVRESYVTKSKQTTDLKIYINAYVE